MTRITPANAGLFPGMRDRGRGSGDVASQLARTRQWEAERSQLLRPAAFHAWAPALESIRA